MFKIKLNLCLYFFVTCSLFTNNSLCEIKTNNILMLSGEEPDVSLQAEVCHCYGIKTQRPITPCLMQRIKNDLPFPLASSLFFIGAAFLLKNIAN